ncbi:MAG: CBS domain-containing protein [Acidobacteria bacterium]|nr:CBS domain-containing protein [Acidobacteriota bacterium]
MSHECLVRDFMTAPATSIPQDAMLIDAVLTLRRTGFRHLPIVNGDRLVGLITDRDIHRLAPSLLGRISPEEYNSIFENTPLARVMTRNPQTVTPDTSLREAARILQERKLGCLPVVDAGHLVGIITTADMLRVLLHILDGVTAPRIPSEGH